jgi:hypothetical protein
MPNKDAELIAIFDTSKFRVSSTVMPYNSGKIYGNGLYEYNQEVTLNAI